MSVFYIFANLAESVLPFIASTTMYFWWQRVVMPISFIFVHDWFVAKSTLAGVGAVGLHQIWACLILAFGQWTHYYFFEKEHEERVFFSNLHLVLVHLRDNQSKTGKCKFTQDELNQMKAQLNRIANFCGVAVAN